MNRTLEEWIHPAIELRNSETEGTGLITTVPFAEGESMIRFGGEIFTLGQIKLGAARYQSVIVFQHGLVIGYSEDLEPVPSDFLNHSCTPNVGMRDAVTVTAIRDIKANEELLIDYAFFCAFGILDEFTCRCGTAQCRSTITADDWQRDDLQERYGKFFSPCLRRD